MLMLMLMLMPMPTRWLRLRGMMLMLAAGLAASRAEAQLVAPRAPKAPATSKANPVLPLPGKPVIAAGASFVEPEGWIKVAPDRPGLRGCFLSPDSRRDEPSLMILVEIGRPREAGLRANAQRLADGWGGKVLDAPTTLDGVEAVRVRVSSRGEGMKPVEGVVAIKDGAMYLLMGGTTPGRGIADKVEEVRRGWKWVKPTPAATTAGKAAPERR